MAVATGTRRVVLVEDAGWKDLRPLTWMRPAADLLVGARTNRERWQTITDASVRVLCREHVASLSDATHRGEAQETGLSALWVRDRWIPNAVWAREAIMEAASVAYEADGVIVALSAPGPIPDGVEAGSDPFWGALADGLDRRPATGTMIQGLSDLVRASASLIDGDLEAQLFLQEPTDELGEAVAYAPGRIRVGKGCQIDHGSILDARDGPIVLGPGTVVAPHTWIRGPFGCRENCLLLGGRIGGGSYFGPQCRVRGEVEASTFLGYGNKVHDGFVGHSFIGEWVNLGALTTTSDLKNNYGEVVLDHYGRATPTGQRKIGSFIGDHAKTQIGAMLNTGSVIGLAANVFGSGALYPKWLPDFAWGTGREAATYDVERCLATMETVFSRRNHRMSPAIAEAVRRAYDETTSDRDRWIRAAQGRLPEE